MDRTLRLPNVAISDAIIPWVQRAAFVFKHLAKFPLFWL